VLPESWLTTLKMSVRGPEIVFDRIDEEKPDGWVCASRDDFAAGV